MTTQYTSVVLLAGAALALSACGSKPPTISIGAKSTTEQTILAEILAAHLEKQLPGVHIERKLNLGGAQAVQGAMQSSSIDAFVEDIGTMIGMVLKEDVPAEESTSLERVKTQYQTLYRLSILQPLGFHHRFVVVRSAPLKSETLTGLAESGKAFKFGVEPDLTDRKDAFLSITTQYRISLSELPKPLDGPFLYEALRSRAIDLAAGYATDAWVGESGFELLKDDRSMFQPHPVCVVVRSQALSQIAGFQKALEGLSGKITDQAIHKMNQEVDLKHRPAEEVAKAFLASAGL